jgi:hypothetical protein
MSIPFILQDMTYCTDFHVTEGKRVTALNVNILVRTASYIFIRGTGMKFCNGKGGDWDK